MTQIVNKSDLLANPGSVDAVFGHTSPSANSYSASIPVADCLVDQVAAIGFSRGLLPLPRTEEQGGDVRVRHLVHVREKIIHLVVLIVVERVVLRHVAQWNLPQHHRLTYSLGHRLVET